MKNKTKLSLLKKIIIALALLNLVALFIFEYKLPSFLSRNNGTTSTATVSTESTEATGNRIHFDNDTITYDGTGELDLLSGVSVIDAEGNPLNNEVFVHIKTADTLTEKSIIYTVDTAEGQISATRNLVLSNYTGPSITLPETMPELEETTLDNMLSELLNNDAFKANDGFGNNLSAQVVADYTIDPREPSVVHYTLSFTNIFNDIATVPVDINITSNRPSLVLTTNAVTIAVNSGFQPMEYVEEATDIHGNSCYNRVHIEGSVDIATPGSYTLVFTCTDSNGNQSHPQTLVVKVE